jgi:hypothetical protein
MDFIVGLPKSSNKSFIMVVVDHLSKYNLFFLLKTHLQHSLWLNFSWIRSSSFMACCILLFFIVNQLSPIIFGKKCSSYKAPNCISTQLIIPTLMVKLKFSTNVWKHILGVFHWKGRISGLNGYH